MTIVQNHSGQSITLENHSKRLLNKIIVASVVL